MDGDLHRRRTTAPAVRVMLVDGHDVSRAACRALLRTEGVDVVADLLVSEEAISVAARRCPDAVILDVTPGDSSGLALAWRLSGLEHAPTVVLTSSADRSMFGEQLAAFPFVAKADLCAAEILSAVNGDATTATKAVRHRGLGLG